MMKKMMNKIFVILLVALGSISLVGCKKNNNNNDEIPPLILPTETTKAVNDEVIFVTFDNYGKVDSMKASNHINDAKFLMYQTHGHFLSDGHLNITNGEANIEIEDNIANVPSLREYSDFFYMLNLNDFHYSNLLPFEINISYKFNEILSDFSTIIGQSGDVEVTFQITPNSNAHIYFQRNYAAQIQIPINIKNSKIIEANDVMGKVLLGGIETLAYIVMPGESKVITIKLNTNNFHFEGLQATYQPFDMLEMAGGLIDFNQLGLDQLSALPDAIDLISTELNEAKDQMSPLFVGLKENLNEINQLSSNEQLSQFDELVAGLNSSDINTVYNLFGNVTSYKTFDIGGNRHAFIAIVNDIKTHTSNLTSHHTKFNNHVQYLIDSYNENITFAEKYEQEFQKFINNIDAFIEIKESFEQINRIDITNLENIINNKDTIIRELNQIDINIETIKVNFNELITEMYFFGSGFETISKNIYGMLESLSSIFDEIGELAPLFINLSNKIDEGVTNDWFSAIGNNAFPKFNEELKREDEENPGLIQGLQMALVYKEVMGLDEKVEEAKQLLALYEFDNEIQMRPIDFLYLGFVEMNKALQIKQEGQDVSLYDGISKLVSLKDFLQLIPAPLNIEMPSFLSEENKLPSSVQFIVKQQGF